MMPVPELAPARAGATRAAAPVAAAPETEISAGFGDLLLALTAPAAAAAVPDDALMSDEWETDGAPVAGDAGPAEPESGQGSEGAIGGELALFQGLWTTIPPVSAPTAPSPDRTVAAPATDAQSEPSIDVVGENTARMSASGDPKGPVTQVPERAVRLPEPNLPPSPEPAAIACPRQTAIPPGDAADGSPSPDAPAGVVEIAESETAAVRPGEARAPSSDTSQAAAPPQSALTGAGIPPEGSDRTALEAGGIPDAWRAAGEEIGRPRLSESAARPQSRHPDPRSDETPGGAAADVLSFDAVRPRGGDTRREAPADERERERDGTQRRPLDEASRAGNAAVERGVDPRTPVTQSADRPEDDAESRAEAMSGRSIDRVAGAVRLSLAQGGVEVRLRLHPETLGEVRVQVRWEGGVLSARLEAATSWGREALESGVHHLRAALADQGISLERLSIGLGMEQEPRPFSQSAGTPPEERDTPHPVAEVNERRPAERAESAAGLGRVDVRV